MREPIVNRSLRALLIEPSQEDARAIVAVAQRDQWKVVVATSGRRGIELALSSPFDLLVLEACLPDMEGFAISRLLRESEATASMPILFHSRAGNIEDRLRGLREGAVDYVVKPSCPEELVERMHIHFRLAHRHAEAIAPDPSDVVYDQVVLRAAINFISGHLRVISSVGKVARHVGVHEKKLSHIFQHYMGTTVFRWVSDERMRRSRQLLCATAMSVQDIAAEMGFSSACNFTTAFRQKTGKTPSQYRKDRVFNSAGNSSVIASTTPGIHDLIP